MSDLQWTYSTPANARAEAMRVECPNCAGRGTIPVYIYEGSAGNMYPMYHTTCPECSGAGSRPLRISDFGAK